MPNYLLLLEEDPASFAHVTPEEMQRIIARYSAWTERMAREGHLVGGHKLREEGGRLMTRRGGEVTVTDGPYAEAREVVGGLFVIAAEDYDAAVRIARDCPHLEYGSIRVREIEVVGAPV